MKKPPESINQTRDLSHDAKITSQKTNKNNL